MIRIQEIEKAIKERKNGKAPGVHNVRAEMLMYPYMGKWAS